MGLEWLSTFAVVALVAGAVCIAVMAVVAHDLRRHLQRRLDGIADRQAEQTRRVADGVEALRRDQLDLEERIRAMAQSQRRVSAELAEIHDRLGDAGGAGPRSGDRTVH